MSAPIILCDTAGMTNERWLECRMHGPTGKIPYTVGGSDVAAIFGISPWVTPLELWKIKKGQMKPADKLNAAQLEMGHLLEPIAAHFYAQKSGNKVTDDTFLYQHADFPYALANFDRRYERKADGKKGILECKSCTYHKATEWAKGAYPKYYELQLRFYLAVADVDIGQFAAIWGNNPDTDFAMPALERDKAAEDLIFEKLDRWIWSLENDVPPTMENIEPKLALESLARIYGKSEPALGDIFLAPKFEPELRKILDLQSQREECQDEIKKIDKEIEARSVRFAELMEKHERGILESTTDNILIDFVTKTSTRTDTKALKKNYPKVYADVVTTSESRKMKFSVQAK